MITVIITRTTTTVQTLEENVVATETPTELMEDRYSGNGKTCAVAKTYAIQPVQKEKTVKTTLIEQTIEDDAQFNFAAVVKALNNL